MHKKPEEKPKEQEKIVTPIPPPVKNETTPKNETNTTPKNETNTTPKNETNTKPEQNTTNTNTANTTNTNLSNKITQAQGLVDTLAVIGNYYIEVSDDNFIDSTTEEGFYEYTVNHNLNSDILKVQVFDTQGNELVNCGKKIDKNNYKIINDEKISVIFIADKSYLG